LDRDGREREPGDWQDRLFRYRKAASSAELSRISERLTNNAEIRRSRIVKLSKGRLLGRFVAASHERLRQVARILGVHQLTNLGGCPAR
jgi:hypothetical protein